MDVLVDNSGLSLEDVINSIIFAAKTLQETLGQEGSIVHSDGDKGWCTHHLPEPTTDRLSVEACQVSRLDCVELLSAVFLDWCPALVL